MRSHKSSLKKAFTLLVISFACASVSSAGTWQEHEAKLSGLRQKVKDTEAETKHLIEAKNHAHDQSEVKALVEQIGVSHQAFIKAATQLDTEELHVRFKHPEHAEKADVKYARRHTKSLDEMEGEIGIDGRLDRLKARVLATFPISKKNEAVHSEPKIHPAFRKPASVVQSDDDKPESIKLVK
ncbi:MAG: hypothetical protein V4692_01565 [Bdellovibrionota bacterium]